MLVTGEESGDYRNEPNKVVEESAARLLRSVVWCESCEKSTNRRKWRKSVDHQKGTRRIATVSVNVRK